MGHHKNKADENRDNALAAWTRKAQYEGYECEMCGRRIEDVDREAYFRSKRCSECANYAGKDD